MAFYVHTATPASGGTNIGREPAWQDGIQDDIEPIGGSGRTLSGRIAMDLLTTKRVRRVKMLALTNTQRNNVRAHLVAFAPRYWAFPHESADLYALCTDAPKETPKRLPGDSATAPHWDVEFTLHEV